MGYDKDMLILWSIIVVYLLKVNMDIDDLKRDLKKEVLMDFYEENDRMEEAIAQALIDYHMSLEPDQEIPDKIQERADEILNDWDHFEEIEKTDELHNNSLDNATIRRVK